jgi:hypothetical protein
MHLTLHAYDEVAIGGTRISCLIVPGGFVGCTLDQGPHRPIANTYGVGMSRGGVSIGRVKHNGGLSIVYSHAIR